MRISAIALVGFLMYLIGLQTSIEYLQLLGLGTFGTAGLGRIYMEFRRGKEEFNVVLKEKGLEEVKDEEKEKVARDVGRELGREIRKGFEENWKSYVIAGVIVMGCDLILSSLNSPWYIITLSILILYQIVYYSLSKLFRAHVRK